MTNLAELVSKESVIKALEKIVREDLKLRPGTKYSLEYKGRSFPPKEVVRVAAKLQGISDTIFNSSSLSGGDNTNSFLEKKGFTIIKHTEWSNIKRNPKWHRDEIILALDLYFDSDRGSIDARNPKIIELSELINKLPLITSRFDAARFRNPNGVSLKLSNFLAIDPNHKGKGMTSFSKLDKEIFEEFVENKAILQNMAYWIKKISNDDNLIDNLKKIEDDEVTELDSATEGQILYKMHKLRERDKKIVDHKKRSVLSQFGKLDCEACEFNFQNKYGDLGAGFIECHHIIPLSQFQVAKETKLEDLALVCSNCHRMIHRSQTVYSINEFKQTLFQKAI